MSTPFTAVVQSPPSGRGTALVLDAATYAQHVILRDAAVPWQDVTQYVNFLGQVEGLLKPDVRLVDLGAFYADALTRRADLPAAMAARSRTGYALKTLLADEDLASAAHDLLAVAGQTSRLPLAVQVPSPLTWLARTHVTTGGVAADLDVDQGENASMYYADWLRRFSSLPVSLLLLDGRAEDLDGLPAEELSAYTPLHNAAEHYRWPLGLRTADGVALHGQELKGVVVPPAYWIEEGVPVPEGDFALAEIPVEAEPESVLTRLDRWR
jgi:hypothetical protein